MSRPPGPAPAMEDAPEGVKRASGRQHRQGIHAHFLRIPDMVRIHRQEQGADHTHPAPGSICLAQPSPQAIHGPDRHSPRASAQGPHGELPSSKQPYPDVQQPVIQWKLDLPPPQQQRREDVHAAGPDAIGLVIPEALARQVVKAQRGGKEYEGQHHRGVVLGQIAGPQSTGVAGQLPKPCRPRLQRARHCRPATLRFSKRLNRPTKGKSASCTNRP